ncbi:MAG: hypothetical protein RL227_1856 [Pseudomonadota bacterium]
MWAVGDGLAIGAALGTPMGRLVLHLRLRHAQAVGYDDFPAPGLIARSYGMALLLATCGFLAVFAAGVALRQVPRRETGASQHAAALEGPALCAPPAPLQADDAATHPAHAPAFLAQAMLGSTERIERIGEVVAVVLLGALLWAVDWPLVGRRWRTA